MPAWLDKLFGSSTAADKDRENPVVHDAVTACSRVYSQLSLGTQISEARRDELSRSLFLDINRICNSPEPGVTCRDELIKAVLDLAIYKVLMVPPLPEPDFTGLRDQPGISGELGQHIQALSEKNDSLRSALFGVDTDDPADFVRCAYWEKLWRSETIDGTRRALGDKVNWYPAFVHAACVRQEHQYRWDLELPAAFDESIARDAATNYAVFTDIVVAGSADPAAEWREYCAGTSTPMPRFESAPN